MPDRPTGSPSRADDLAHELQVEIITGRIPLGTRLRQEDLAERFGVSRTPIREALRQLQAIGLVEQLGHRGALVRSFSPDECRNIFLVRAELEGLAAERASGRLTTYDHADLDTAQALLRAGGERVLQLPASDEEGRLIALQQCSTPRSCRAAPTTTTASPRRSTSPTRSGRESCCTRTCWTPARRWRGGCRGRADGDGLAPAWPGCLASA
jgi:DNA-binding transcriptional regulator YhcF (GntR family)